MKYLAIILLTIPTLIFAQTDFPDALEVIEKVDENMIAKTNITKSDMVIHGSRKSRTITSISYTEGEEKSMTEYLAPEREEGQKMLKLDDMLWIYSPTTDRTIQLSGHMLRQSVMGSDMSYEDMMEDRKLTEMYDATITAEEEIEGIKTWKIELTTKVDDATYETQTIWIDQEKFVPLKQEQYAKSGELLKRITFSDIQEYDGRWYPSKINYKDMLNSGNGTDLIILEIEFDSEIDDYIFNKAYLKK